MSNEMNGVEAPLVARRKTSKRSSTAVKLVQAAALAAVLVPLGSVSVETTTCGFGGYYGNNTGSGCVGSSPTHEQFQFNGPYTFDLTLRNPIGDFFVTISDNPMSDAEFALRVAATPFSNYSCVPLVDPSIPVDPCRDFVVDVGGGRFDGYDFTIHWNYDSEHNGFADMGGRITVLHNIGSVPGDNYDQDMCQTFNNCSYNPDPSISSGDTDFQSLAVSLNPNGAAAVPEPATLILLGSGLGGVLYRRRRRKAKPA